MEDFLIVVGIIIFAFSIIIVKVINDSHGTSYEYDEKEELVNRIQELEREKAELEEEKEEDEFFFEALIAGVFDDDI